MATDKNNKDDSRSNKQSGLIKIKEDIIGYTSDKYEESRDIEEHKPQAGATANSAPRYNRKLIKALTPIAILLIAVFIAGYLIFSPAVVKPPKNAEQVYNITAQVIKLADFAPKLTFYGEVIAAKMIDLRLAVAGKVVMVNSNFNVGAQISKGEELIGLDPFVFEGAVLEREKALARANSKVVETKAQISENNLSIELAKQQLEIDRKHLERARQLAKKGTIAQRTVDERQKVVNEQKRNLVQLQSQLEIRQQVLKQNETEIASAEWNLDKAKRDLADTTLMAPFDGFVTEQNVEVGKQLMPNEKIGKIYAKDQLEVKFTIPETLYSDLNGAENIIGKNIDITWINGDTSRSYQAIISRIGANVDTNRGGIELYARFEDAKDLLQPGIFVTITMNGETNKNVACISENAISDDNTVFIVSADKRLDKKAIQIVDNSNSNVLVTGLENNDTIAVSTVAGIGVGVLVDAKQTIKSITPSCALALDDQNNAKIIDQEPIDDGVKIDAPDNAIDEQ